MVMLFVTIRSPRGHTCRVIAMKKWRSPEEAKVLRGCICPDDWYNRETERRLWLRVTALNNAAVAGHAAAAPNSFLLLYGRHLDK